MPANNSKVMSDEILEALNNKYSIVYNAENNTLIVSLKTWKRSTVHNADDFFHINSKVNPKRRVIFSKTAIDIFKELQQNDKTKHITLFDVQNAANKLKVMYQKVTQQKVVELCMKGFDGIKRI